jgi:hypothetical protein
MTLEPRLCDHMGLVLQFPVRSSHVVIHSFVVINWLRCFCRNFHMGESSCTNYDSQHWSRLKPPCFNRRGPCDSARLQRRINRLVLKSSYASMKADQHFVNPNRQVGKDLSM